jgi:ribonucleotide monophosphatase NagD (HAD superfamily)
MSWDSMLVLTGISSEDDVATSAVVPTWVAKDLSALFAPRSG